MRKHNEGYTLVLVMVVLAVLSVLATVILTAADRNLEAHKNGVVYMQNKYQAQGEIEKFLGYLEAHIGEENVQLPDMAGFQNMSCSSDSNEISLVAVSYKEVEGEQVEVLRIDCTIQITGGVVNEGIITDLTGYTYTSYEISTNGGAD